MNMKRLVLLALLSITFVGCGTLFIADQKAIPLYSEPSEAEVVINGIVRGTTPLTLELDNHEDHIIQFRKEGYEIGICTLDASVSGGIVFLDVLGGGLIAVAIDAATGEWRRIKEDLCEVHLPKEADE